MSALAASPQLAPPAMTPLVFWDVDTQRDFMDPEGALHVPGAERIVPALAQLTSHARALHVPIIASVCAHDRADAEISASPDFRRTFPAHCLRGTHGQEKIGATAMLEPLVIENRPYEARELARYLAASPTEILIEKQQFDVFSNPATAQLVTALQIRTVVVYGVALDVCVHHAAIGLAERGCTVRVVRDATAALDSRAATTCMVAWRRLGITLTTAAAVIAATGAEDP